MGQRRGEFDWVVETITKLTLTEGQSTIEIGRQFNAAIADGMIAADLVEALKGRGIHYTKGRVSQLTAAARLIDEPTFTRVSSQRGSGSGAKSGTAAPVTRRTRMGHR